VPADEPRDDLHIRQLWARATSASVRVRCVPAMPLSHTRLSDSMIDAAPAPVLQTRGIWPERRVAVRIEGPSRFRGWAGERIATSVSP
jgi:hypothetical protein